MRLFRRSLSGFHLPSHLRMPFLTPTSGGRCMIVGAPFWRYFLAVVPPEPAVAPLINAIRELDASSRPFRILSHVDEAGKVFNASFFETEENMNRFLTWYTANALEPGSAYHVCLTSAAMLGDVLPTGQSLLFGKGVRVLADTRFGEFQLGMALRYSHYTLRDGAMHEEARMQAAAPELEEQIASQMLLEGISYFGRLVMEQPAAKGGMPQFISAARYGSVEEARRGTLVTRELLGPQMSRWFSAHKDLVGTATRVLEL